MAFAAAVAFFQSVVMPCLPLPAESFHGGSMACCRCCCCYAALCCHAAATPPPPPASACLRLHCRRHASSSGTVAQQRRLLSLPCHATPVAHGLPAVACRFVVRHGSVARRLTSSCRALPFSFSSRVTFTANAPSLLKAKREDRRF